MNKLESTIYNLVRKNPALKQFVRNMYQGIFDLLPRKKEYFASPYQYREGFFFGFHDVTPFSFDETKLLANQNRFNRFAAKIVSTGATDLGNPPR